VRLVKATYVFLDTEVFVQSNFDYTSTRFERLKALARSRRIQAFTTDLTIREVQSKIKQRVERGISKPIAPILRNSNLPEVQSLFSKLDGQQITDELCEQLNGFIEATPVHVLEIKPTVLRPVIDAYFDEGAPFGPGKRKAEFPDAIALQTLKDWCDHQQRNMAVVSNDQGVQEACKQHEFLQSYENLGQYLNVVASEDEMLSRFVRTMMVREDVKHDVVERAVPEFQQMGAYVTDVDGEVDHITFTGIEYDEGDVGVLELSDNRAHVELLASLSYTAEISYDLLENSGFVSRVVDRIGGTQYRTVEVVARYQGPAPESFKIEKLSVEGPGIGLGAKGNRPHGWY